jgi:pimeloyl-ACP methyl ester carboxylesterase
MPVKFRTEHSCPRRPRRYALRPPLILVNGLLIDQAECWDRNHRFWRRHFDVHMPNLLVYDGPALHKRIDDGRPISVDYLVEQLHLYLQAFVQTPPYHLVASSLGGKVAVEYAVRYPDQVARLVLLCPSGMGDEERLPVVAGVHRSDLRAVLQSLFYNHDPIRSADPQVVTSYERRFGDRRWRAGLLRTIRGTMGHCVREQLARVTQPTLLISGGEDRIVDPVQAEEAARLLPRGQFLPIPQCGHAPQVEKPRLINRVVVDFLASGGP